MSAWQDLTLGDVCELKRGYDLPKDSRVGGTVPVISSSGPSGFHNEVKVQPPGVVTGRYGTLGDVFYVSEGFWPLNTALYVRDFKGNDPRYIAALLRSMNLAQYDGAAAVPGLNRNQLHTIPVRIPPLSVQRVITSVLGGIDDLINNDRKRVRILEDIARTIYREWFVHLRYPGHEKAIYVDSALGLIPNDWAVVRLAEVADARRGLSWDRSSETEFDGTPVVTIPNLKSRLTYHDSTLLANVTASDRARFSLIQDDILLIGSNGNPDRVGYAVRVPDATEALFASFLMRVRTNTSVTSAKLLYHQLSDPSGIIGDLKATAVGATGLRNLRITALREALIIVPDPETRRRFDEACDPIHRSADVLDTQMQKLSQLRDLLLPKLVTGQIDVSSLDLHALVGDSVV